MNNINIRIFADGKVFLKRNSFFTKSFNARHRKVITMKEKKKKNSSANSALRPTGQTGFSKPQLDQLIQKRAYTISQGRGNVRGQEWQDWFEAEKQIKQELQIK